MYTVYEMTCNKTGEKYIGCTKQPLNKRFNSHVSRHYNDHLVQYKLYQFTRKQGFDMSIKKIKSFEDKLQAMSFEAKMIKERGTLNTFKTGSIS